jgi:hypothetical protein
MMIDMCCTCTGGIDTDMFAGSPPSFVQAVIDATPMKRLGTIYDLGESVSLLASESARWISGQAIVVAVCSHCTASVFLSCALPHTDSFCTCMYREVRSNNPSIIIILYHDLCMFILLPSQLNCTSTNTN